MTLLPLSFLGVGGGWDLGKCQVSVFEEPSDWDRTSGRVKIVPPSLVF